MKSFINTEKMFKSLASIKLAVFVILSLAIITAIGTFVESKYDAQAAAKLVYKTPWMFGVLGLLAINLIAVMIDRWPWKKRHVPFLSAHIGILLLLLGSWVTMKFGIDGSLRIEPEKTARHVILDGTVFQVWSSFTGDSYTQIINKEVDFFKNSPKDQPLELPLSDGVLKVVDYSPYTLPSKKVVASKNEKVGSAVRFMIKNANVNFNDWLVSRNQAGLASMNLGPAKVHLGPAPDLNSSHENEIFLTPEKDKSQKLTGRLEYVILSKSNKYKTIRGVAVEGDRVQTPWMGLELTIVRFEKHASEIWEYKTVARPTPMTMAAIKVQYLNEEHWIGLNDSVKFFAPQVVYFVGYGNQRLDLGFDLRLLDFKIGRYQGTNRAMSYQSLVATPDSLQHDISMNEPLKYHGYTFYQASFQEDESGKPTASILSVNYDPGRWIKYLGSLILSFGMAWLYVTKRKQSRATAPKEGVQ